MSVPTPCGADFDLDWTSAKPLELDVGPDRLFALEQGQGPTVLMMHGYTCEATHFRYQLPALAAAGFRAIALDLPGHGHSNKPAGPYDAERFLGAVEGVIEQLRLERVHLVGHSMGGAIALALSQRLPDVVDRVALISPYVPGLALGKTFGLWVNTLAPVPLLARVLMGVQNRAAYDASNAAAVADVEKLLQADGGRWRDYPWAMFNVPGMRRVHADAGKHFVRSWRPVLSALPQLGARGLVIWGERDQIVLHGGLARVAEQTGARPLSLPCGHCAHMEAPEPVNEALLALLQPARAAA